MDRIKEIINKSKLNQADIDFLMANERLLTEADKARLGLVAAPEKATEEEVVEEPKEEEEVVEEPKKAPKKAPKKTAKKAK